MGNIKVTNTIETDSVNIDFNIDDSTVHYPSIKINIQTDVDLTLLINKLIEFVEINHKLVVKYVDEHGLIESNSKIKLIKETLDEVFVKFNDEINNEAQF
jgi:hypothetical protein